MYCSPKREPHFTIYFLDLQFAHLPDVEEKNHGRATRERRVQKPCPKCSVDISPLPQGCLGALLAQVGPRCKPLASRCVKRRQCIAVSCASWQTRAPVTPTSPGLLVQVNHEMAAVIERLQAAARAAQDGDTEAAAKVCGHRCRRMVTSIASPEII